MSYPPVDLRSRTVDAGRVCVNGRPLRPLQGPSITTAHGPDETVAVGPGETRLLQWERLEATAPDLRLGGEGLVVETAGWYDIRVHALVLATCRNIGRLEVRLDDVCVATYALGYLDGNLHELCCHPPPIQLRRGGLISVAMVNLLRGPDGEDAGGEGDEVVGGAGRTLHLCGSDESIFAVLMRLPVLD